MVISQPITQVRLTNIAVVRLKQDGARFEIACYPNKVRDWRAGLETDISEVLQSDRIFINVSKGRFASDSELKAVFGTADVRAVSRTILTKGSVQVSEKERRAQAVEFGKEVCTLAAPRLIAKATGVPPNALVVENLLKELKFKPKYKSNASAKATALKVVTKLCDKFPDQIMRALMRATITTTSASQKQVEDFLDKEVHAQRLEATTGDRLIIEFRAAPAEYRRLEEFVASLPQPSTLTILNMHDEDTQQSDIVRPERPALTKPETDAESELLVDEAASSSSESSDAESWDSLAHEPATRKTGAFAAAMAELNSEVSSGDEEVTQMADADWLKPVVGSSKKKTAEVDLDRQDMRSRKQQIKVKERKERDKDRKNEERKKQEASDMALTAAVEAEMRAGEPVVEPTSSSPTWCECCRADYGLMGQVLRSHLKSGFHVFNHKRRLRNLEPARLDEYEDLSRDVREGFLAVEI